MASIRPDSRQLIHQTDAAVVGGQCAVGQLIVDVGRSHHRADRLRESCPCPIALKRAFRARDRSRKIDRLTRKPSMQIRVSGTTPLKYPGKRRRFSTFFRFLQKKPSSTCLFKD